MEITVFTDKRWAVDIAKVYNRRNPLCGNDRSLFENLLDQLWQGAKAAEHSISGEAESSWDGGSTFKKQTACIA